MDQLFKVPVSRLPASLTVRVQLPWMASPASAPLRSTVPFMLLADFMWTGIVFPDGLVRVRVIPVAFLCERSRSTVSVSVASAEVSAMVDWTELFAFRGTGPDDVPSTVPAALGL